MEYFLNFIKQSKDDDNVLTILSDMINSYFFHYTHFFKNVKILHKVFISNDYNILKNINIISLDILELYNNIPLFKSNIDELIECIMCIKKQPKFIYNLKLQILHWSKIYKYTIDTDRVLKNNDIFSLNDLKCQIKRKKVSIPKTLRINVWNKYIGEEIGRSLCLCCEKKYIVQSNFECGHIIAESNGGMTIVDNLLPICSICNKSMKNLNLIEFKKRYFS